MIDALGAQRTLEPVAPPAQHARAYAGGRVPAGRAG